jgi:hypothetical protein
MLLKSMNTSNQSARSQTVEIWIPSRGRPSEVEGVIRQIPKNLHQRTTICVSDNDPRANEYFERWAGDITVVQLNANGIADKRLRMVQACKAPFIFMIDDDVRFYKRKSAEDWHLIPMDHDDFTMMFVGVQVALASNEYVAVGISPREGNNHMKAPREENTRLMRAVAYARDEYLACEHHRVQVMEDFDIQLQLLRRGLKTCSFTLYAQDQRGTNVAGGCSNWRTHEVHEQSAKKLAELHMGFVKTVEKKNKTGGAFGTRTEVMIGWKRAYKWGVEHVALQKKA